MAGHHIRPGLLTPGIQYIGPQIPDRNYQLRAVLDNISKPQHSMVSTVAEIEGQAKQFDEDHSLGRNKFYSMRQDTDPSAVSSPKSTPKDGEATVPSPSFSGGITMFWSIANTLARNMLEKLETLRGSYTTEGGVLTEEGMLVDKLVCLLQEEDLKAIADVRKVCWRIHYFQALKHMPPYDEAVQILRIRLNFCLGAWRAHMEHREACSTENGGVQTDPTLCQHLKEWLDEVGRLPRYPGHLPLYVTDETPMRLSSRPQPVKTAATPVKLKNGLLDFRTASRQIQDDRSRHFRPSTVESLFGHLASPTIHPSSSERPS